MIRLLLLLPVVTIVLGLSLVEKSGGSTSSGCIKYPVQLTGAFTGGFGEETCRFCHFDYKLNPTEGELRILGLKSAVAPQKIFKITIEITRKKLGKAGFQLSARFANGRQAGEFLLDGNNRIMFTTTDKAIQYVQHSSEGVNTTDANKNSWTLHWQAPQKISGVVIFNIAANAANGDNSEFGDFIFHKEIQLPPKNN